jgi:hypothetical protein
LRKVAGILILAAGVIGFVVFLFARLSAHSDTLQRFSVPGSEELELEPGSYRVYWEAESLFESWPDLECSVAGGNVPLSETWFNTKYSIEGRRGVSVYSFTIEKRGRYEISARGKTKNPVTLAVGPTNWAGMLLTVLGGIAILGGSIACGVFLILKRQRP